MVVVGCVVVFVGVVAAVVAVVLFGLVLVAFVVARWGCCSCRAFCQCCVLVSVSCSSRVPSLAALKDLDCILFGGLLGCRLFPWVLGGAPGLLGVPLVGPRPSQRDLGFLWVALGDSWGVLGLPPGLLGDPLGGSGPSLGGPWGTLGQPWGAEGRPQRALLANRRLCKIIGFTV